MDNVVEFPQWLSSVSLILGVLVIMTAGIKLMADLRHGYRVSAGVIVGAAMGGVVMMLPRWFPFMVDSMYRILFSAQSSDATEPDDPESAPDPEPAEPLDLSGPLTFLIIAAGLAILAGLIYGIYRATASAKRRRDATKQDRAETAALWRAAKDLHSEGLATVASYELDIVKAIDYPAFNDVSIPEVSAMSKAMRRARDIELQIETDSDIGGSDELLSTYRDAVDEFVTAVEIAEAKAKKIRWKSIPEDEQKDLKLAKKLLSQAEDPGTPEQMRHTLYQRLKTVIGRLNQSHGSKLVPTGTIGQIEQQTRMLIDA